MLWTYSKYQQTIKDDEMMRRTGITRNVVQRIVTRKLQLFGHISQAKDDRVIRIVMFGVVNETGKGEAPETIGRWLKSGLVS